MRIVVRMARTREELAAIVPQWEELARHALEPNPFNEPWMLLPALDSQEDRSAFRCALIWVEDAGAAKLGGLFPFTRVARYKGLPLSVLSSWRHTSWQIGTPLLRADCARECLHALLGWLGDEGDGTAGMELRYLACEGAFHDLLADELRTHKATVFATDTFTRALLRRGSDAETYLANALSSAARRRLRRNERRLSRRGRVQHVALRREHDAESWIADFLRLEAAGWKGTAGGALASREANRRFALAALGEAHRRGRLQMVGIDVDGRPIARRCSILAGAGSYAFRTAYDEAFSYYSPGFMAEVDNLREFHAVPGVQWMDSMAPPDGAVVNRLWAERRRIQHLVIGVEAWGELWVSLLPLMRWAKQRIRQAVGKETAPQ